MKDRLPLHPGRVTMTPVPGQANTYDMVRADEPIEVGDALNKANLLPDDVCTALGIPTTSVPKDALLKLAEKCTADYGVYDGDGASSRMINLGYTPLVVVVFIQAGSSGTGTANRSGSAMAVTDNPCIINTYNALSIDSGGFSVYYNDSQGVLFNLSGRRYFYLALRW